jgi:hypothetical protein
MRKLKQDFITLTPSLKKVEKLKKNLGKKSFFFAQKKLENVIFLCSGQTML